MKLFETKDFSGGVKDVDAKKRIVTGYLSAFNNVDYDNDVIEKGAFTKTILERKEKIRFLNQHDWKQPHGFFDILKEDNNGLYFESKPMLDTSYSRDALILYEAGVLKEHSIGFQVVLSDFKNDMRIIKEIKLYEGSNVTLGANGNTPFLGLKSGIKTINNEVSQIVKALKLGNLTDETYIDLEIALKQLQAKAYELGRNTQNDKEPSIDTFKIDEPLNEIKQAFSDF